VRRSWSLTIACLLLLAASGLCTEAQAGQQAAGTATSPPEAAGQSETVLLPEEEEIPEITVEVLGEREGLLSISPAPGEALVEVQAQEIEDTGAQTVMDAIDFTPSVFVRHQGARYENRLSVRGAAPRLVLLDGIPIAREGYTGLGGGAGGKEAGFAGRILYTLPAETIERIDVIRSAGTVVYGPTSATGAVINIVTKEPAEGEQVSAGATYGSYQRARTMLHAGVSDGRLAYLVQAGTDFAESHLPLGEKRFKDIFTKLVYNQPDGSKLLLDYFTLEGRRTIDLSQDFTIVPPRYWQIDPWDEEFVNLVYSKALDEDTTVDYVVYRRNRDFTTSQYINPAFTTLQQDWLEGEDDMGADLRYSIRREDGHMTRAGLQWAKIASDTLQTVYYKKEAGQWVELPRPKVTTVSQDRTTKSLFWNQTIPLRRNLRASLGARYDDPTAHDPAPTYSAGIDADIGANTTWRLHLGTGVEHPLPTDGDIQRAIVPPEASTLSAETGWTVRPDPSSRWQLNVFWSKTEDARILYNDPPGAIGPTAYISKAEDLTTSGVELVYDREVTDSLRWFANYMYLREEVTNDNEPFIPGPLYPTIAEPPSHIAAAGIRGTRGGTRFAVSAKYSGDYMAVNRLMEYAAPVDSFVVFELKLTRPLGSGEVSLFVDNLLDTDYETMPAFPRPGRNYLLSYRTSL
jgi:outer membrane receptor protein involved in Fe transport